MSEDYQVLEELGSGSFGVVYKALEKATGNYVAIKHIDLEGSDDDIREIQQEINLLATCNSPFVTSYKASFVRGTKLWIVMEYLGGGSCLDLLKPGPMPEKYIAIVMKELLSGLDYLHSTGKIHRDIKAANILLSDAGQVKIADFGVAAQLTNIKSQRLTFVGTPFWMAPEVIQEAGYDFHADIWSLGITAMELALGEPPRSDIHPMKVLFIIPKERPPRLEGSKWSKEFKDFVVQCLNKDSDRRPSAKMLLKHSFIRRAGKTDQLQELVHRARVYEDSGVRERESRYYEETLRPMSHVEDDDDDEWIFDTVKPFSRPVEVDVQESASPTYKRRRQSELSHATVMLESLDLDSAPLGDITNGNTPHKYQPSTIKTPKVRHSTMRRSSDGTARRVSGGTRRKASGPQATARRVSAQRQPLGSDPTFGNGTSTVRPFKRVDSGNDNEDATSPVPVEKQVPSASHDIGGAFDSDAENKPPAPPVHQRPVAVPAASKEAMLGRWAYSKAFDAAYQESHANTSDQTKRNALAAMAEAWSKFDEIDPDGEFLFLRSLLDKIQADPKLAAALLPQRVVASQLASLRMASPTKSSSGGGTRTATRTTHSPATTSNTTTPVSSPTKAARTPHLPPSSPSKNQSPSKPSQPSLAQQQQQQQQQSTQPRGLRTSPSKLVLNAQNPHLKKMRSNQALSVAAARSSTPTPTPAPMHAGSTPASPEKERMSLAPTAAARTSTAHKDNAATAGMGNSSPVLPRDSLGLATATGVGMGSNPSNGLVEVLYDRWAGGLASRWGGGGGGGGGGVGSAR